MKSIAESYIKPGEYKVIWKGSNTVRSKAGTQDTLIVMRNVRKEMVAILEDITKVVPSTLLSCHKYMQGMEVIK